MYKGTVNFVARIRGNGLMFPLFEFNPSEPNVEKVEIEGPNGDEVRSTVHLASVASHNEGRSLATKVNTEALNRLAFFRNIAIENARSTGDQFSPLNQQPGVHAIAMSGNLFVSGAFRAVASISADQLKKALEQASPPGERNYGLFRSARLSMSPAEEFMHLYNVLLMLFNDKQAAVDKFIVKEDPTVSQTQQPLKPPGKAPVMETIYTRLRNELAHKRAGVNLDDTKIEMANRLVGLIALTKRAIELDP